MININGIKYNSKNSIQFGIYVIGDQGLYYFQKVFGEGGDCCMYLVLV